jgi:hypothetical protein
VSAEQTDYRPKLMWEVIGTTTRGVAK